MIASLDDHMYNDQGLQCCLSILHWTTIYSEHDEVVPSAFIVMANIVLDSIIYIIATLAQAWLHVGVGLLALLHKTHCLLSVEETGGGCVIVTSTMWHSKVV